MKSPEIDSRLLGPGHYSLLVDGRSYEVFVRKEKRGYLVAVNGHLIVVDSGTVSPGSIKEVVGPQSICSPMPGRVIAIQVKKGDSVKEGEGVLVVEAMKMENEIRATKSGKILEISVKEGETVEAGEELIVIE